MIYNTAYVQTAPIGAIQGALKALVNAVGQEDRKRAMEALEDAVNQGPQAEQPLTHHFTEGLYGREILNPKGSLVVTQTHKEHNFSFVMRGHLLVITEEGHFEIKAPKWFTTKPGTKRILYAIEETVFVTVHPNPTNTEDTQFLENRLATKERI